MPVGFHNQNHGHNPHIGSTTTISWNQKAKPKSKKKKKKNQVWKPIERINDIGPDRKVTILDIINATGFVKHLPEELGIIQVDGKDIDLSILKQSPPKSYNNNVQERDIWIQRTIESHPDKEVRSERMPFQDKQDSAKPSSDDYDSDTDAENWYETIAALGPPRVPHNSPILARALPIHEGILTPKSVQEGQSQASKMASNVFHLATDRDSHFPPLGQVKSQKGCPGESSSVDHMGAISRSIVLETKKDPSKPTDPAEKKGKQAPPVPPVKSWSNVVSGKYVPSVSTGSIPAMKAPSISSDDIPVTTPASTSTCNKPVSTSAPEPSTNRESPQSPPTRSASKPTSKTPTKKESNETGMPVTNMSWADMVEEETELVSNKQSNSIPTGAGTECDSEPEKIPAKQPNSPDHAYTNPTEPLSRSELLIQLIKKHFSSREEEEECTTPMNKGRDKCQVDSDNTATTKAASVQAKQGSPARKTLTGLQSTKPVSSSPATNTATNEASAKAKQASPFPKYATPTKPAPPAPAPPTPPPPSQAPQGPLWSQVIAGRQASLPGSSPGPRPRTTSTSVKSESDKVDGQKVWPSLGSAGPSTKAENRRKRNPST